MERRFGEPERSFAVDAFNFDIERGERGLWIGYTVNGTCYPNFFYLNHYRICYVRKNVLILGFQKNAFYKIIIVMSEKTRYSDAELEEFRTIIKEKLEAAKRDYELLKATIMNVDGNDVTDTSPTFKVLEEGAATLSKEEAGQLAQRQMKFIQNLQAALIRIENKTYGICRETGKLIPKERLRAVPHATLSIEAKKSQNK
jgi:RNA polymerase-binding transcription factor DksA